MRLGRLGVLFEFLIHANVMVQHANCMQRRFPINGLQAPHFSVAYEIDAVSQSATGRVNENIVPPSGLA